MDDNGIPNAVMRYKAVYSYEECILAADYLKENGKLPITCYTLDNLGDSVKALYVFSALNADSGATDIIDFLSGDKVNVSSWHTYLLLQDLGCENHEEHDFGQLNSFYLNGVSRSDEDSKTHAVIMLDPVGEKGYDAPELADKSLISFEPMELSFSDDLDTYHEVVGYGYNVKYDGQLIFELYSCLELSEEMELLIREGLVQIKP